MDELDATLGEIVLPARELADHERGCGKLGKDE
jgi:hypothetical protein